MGTGNARHETAPSMLAAIPVPRLRNMGLAASGSPQANIERNMVFAEVELAAYGPYVSTSVLRHCWKTTVKPQLINAINIRCQKLSMLLGP